MTLFILIMASVIIKNKDKLDGKEFKDKFGCITDGLRITNSVGRLWTVIMVSKWAVLGLILVFLRDYPQFQIFLLLFMTFINQQLLLTHKPF